MISAESLIKNIQKEFAGVTFPSHCGLHAAMAKDDWVDDECVLREITRSEDYCGEWWNVPREHLLQCIMALCYLDGPGMAFYLPAYMTAVIEEPEKFSSSTWQVVFTMQLDNALSEDEEVPDDEKLEMEQHFLEYLLEQFSEIRGERKRVCREFLAYVAACNAYDEHARQIAREALAHEFWSGES